jgi:hypothetical protein
MMGDESFETWLGIVEDGTVVREGRPISPP